MDFFKGSMIQNRFFLPKMAINDKLRSKECPASETVSKKIARDLASLVDNLRGQ